MTAVLSCALAGLAVLTLWPAAQTADARLGPAFRRPSRATARRRGSGRRLLQVLAAGAVTAVVVRVAAGRPHVVVLVITALGVAWAGSELLARARRRRHRWGRRGRLVSMCDALVAELGAGQPPAAALVEVAAQWPELEVARDAARLGGDVPAALRQISRRPGGEPLASVAAGWEVAVRSGAGLAEVLERLSRVLRDDEEVRREVAAQLASPRATATMLAVLPVFGLGLGTAIGADPAGVLLGTVLGACSLAAGCLLAVAGLFWVERIVDAAEV